jgi:bifunctional ADP-heptose synthase (sugar kinase/adenylyltransferase)
VLEGLEGVDEVVEFDEDTPVPLLERLRPDVFVKGGDYDAHTLPEAAVMARWGGRTVVVPYLPGRSTTRIVQEALHGT